MRIDDKHFKCDACFEIFKYDRKNWSEEKAKQQAIANGFDIEKDKELVCNDWYELAKRLGLVSA